LLKAIDTLTWEFSKNLFSIFLSLSSIVLVHHFTSEYFLFTCYEAENWEKYRQSFSIHTQQFWLSIICYFIFRETQLRRIWPANIRFGYQIFDENLDNFFYTRDIFHSIFFTSSASYHWFQDFTSNSTIDFIVFLEPKYQNTKNIENKVLKN